MDLKNLNEFSRPSYNFQNETTPWYCAKQFERFWSIYNRCMIYAHEDALSRCTEVENNIAATLYKMVKAPWPGNFSAFLTSNSDSRRNNNRRKSRKKRKLKRKRKIIQSTKPIPNMFVLTDDDTLQVQLQEQMHLEESDDVDEEFLAFMETSVKHRIKWNHIKETKTTQEQNSSACSRVIDIFEQEHPDDVRGREMGQLYGTSSAKIHGMETAMQLSFDRLSTLHQPTTWPNIPLKLSFE